MNLFSKNYFVRKFIFIYIFIIGKMLLQCFANHGHTTGNSLSIIFFIKMRQHIVNCCLPIIIPGFLVDACISVNSQLPVF